MCLIKRAVVVGVPHMTSPDNSSQMYCQQQQQGHPAVNHLFFHVSEEERHHIYLQSVHVTCFARMICCWDERFLIAVMSVLFHHSSGVDQDRISQRLDLIVS